MTGFRVCVSIADINGDRMIKPHVSYIYTAPDAEIHLATSWTAPLYAGKSGAASSLCMESQSWSRYETGKPKRQRIIIK